MEAECDNNSSASTFAGGPPYQCTCAAHPQQTLRKVPCITPLSLFSSQHAQLDPRASSSKSPMLEFLSVEITCQNYREEGLEVAAGLEPAKTGFADQRLGLFGIATSKPEGTADGKRRPDTSLAIRLRQPWPCALACRHRRREAVFQFDLDQKQKTHPPGVLAMGRYLLEAEISR